MKDLYRQFYSADRILIVTFRRFGNTQMSLIIVVADHIPGMNRQFDAVPNPSDRGTGIALILSLHRNLEKDHPVETDEKISWRGLKKGESGLIS